MFKSLTLYSLPTEFKPTAEELTQAANNHPLLPLGALAAQNSGWVPPDENSDELVKVAGNHRLMTLCIQTKVLPAKVITAETKKRAKVLEQQQGYKVGRKQMRDLKDKVADELRARALVSQSRVNVWIALDRQRLAIDTHSAAVADAITAILRVDLGELPCVPLAPSKPVASSLTRWLSTADFPQGLDFTDSCAFDGGDSGKAKFTNMPMASSEIRKAIENGKICNTMSLNYADLVLFTVNETFAFSKIKLIWDEPATDVDEPTDFSTDMLLDFGALQQMIDYVIKAMSH